MYKRAIFTGTILSLIVIVVMGTLFLAVQPTIDQWKAERRATATQQFQPTRATPPTTAPVKVDPTKQPEQAPTKAADVIATPAKKKAAKDCDDSTTQYFAAHPTMSVSGSYVGKGRYINNTFGYPSCAHWLRVWNDKTENYVFAFVNSEGYWVFSELQPKFLSEDGTLLLLWTTFDGSKATYTFYELRSDEKVSVVFDGKNVSVTRTKTDITDIVTEANADVSDNECNFPHPYILLHDYVKNMSSDPEARIYIGSWNSLESCKTAWIQINQTKPDRAILLIYSDGKLYEIKKDGDRLFWPPEKTSKGFAFIYTGGVIVEFDTSQKKFSEEKASFPLLIELNSVYRDQAITLYRRFPGANDVTKTEPVPCVGTNFIGFCTGTETVKVSRFTYLANGKWNTALVFMKDIKDKKLYGPALVENIREQSGWTSVDQQTITAMFKDGTTITYKLNTDFTVTVVGGK
ncbi:hypothetical protein HY947_01030 [Candidatus Gottesmanbacteria bacterium]|nr:hypothetical protein [Candidatus Gottesmanbacteria bacterium]